jgi:hypothetical protein
VGTNSTGGQGLRRAVAPSEDDGGGDDEIRLCWSPLVSLKATQLIQVANLWPPLDTMRI